MLQCITKITLSQETNANGGNDTGRNKKFHISFCKSFEVYSTWKNLSDTAVVEIPKNVYVTDENGNEFLWGDTTTPDLQKGYINAGGFNNAEVTTTPLIMRGDRITICSGYSYISQVNPDGSLEYATETNEIFKGFVSGLDMKSNIRIHCEDNMWMLKQTSMTQNTYENGGNDIGDVLDDIVTQVNNKYPDNNITRNTNGFLLSVGNFSTGVNETAADVLAKLKKTMPALTFYFRGNELRGGGIVYYPDDQSLGTDDDDEPLYASFNFQRNIISDELQYCLMADVNVGAQCYSVTSAQDDPKNPTTNKMGSPKLTTKRVDAQVGPQSQGNADAFEYYTFFFRDIATPAALTDLGQTYLNRYHYNGFRGHFKTFGLPFVEHGNIIYLTDDLLPERDGHYIVKGVHYTFAVDAGMRQEVELHFRTDSFSDEELSQGM